MLLRQRSVRKLSRQSAMETKQRRKSTSQQGHLHRCLQLLADVEHTSTCRGTFVLHQCHPWQRYTRWKIIQACLADIFTIPQNKANWACNGCFRDTNPPRSSGYVGWHFRAYNSICKRILHRDSCWRNECLCLKQLFQNSHPWSQGQGQWTSNK